MRFLILVALLGCREKTHSTLPMAPDSLDTAIEEQTEPEIPEPNLILGLIDTLIFGHVARGLATGILPHDVVAIYVGRGEPSLGECRDNLCLDIAEAQLIAQDKDTTVHFSYRVPREDSTVPFLFQAVVWQPQTVAPYKSNVVQVTGTMPSWISIAAGAQHTCAVSNDGTGQCWGDSIFTGRSSDAIPPRHDYLSMSSASSHTVALVSSGAIIGWGENGWGQARDSDGSFVAACGGGFHSCGLWDSGSIDCWGLDVSGQCDVPFKLQAIALSCGAASTCAIEPDQHVVCWGESASPEGQFLQVAGGDRFNCGVLLNGALNCWGTAMSYGEQQVPSGVFSSITADNHSACAIESSGDARCWGDNSSGQAPGQVTGPFSQLDVGGRHACGIYLDGSLTCWGDDTYSQVSGPPARPQ